MIDLEAQVADLSAQVAQLAMVNQDLRAQDEHLQQQMANTEQQLADMLAHQYKGRRRQGQAYQQQQQQYLDLDLAEQVVKCLVDDIEPLQQAVQASEGAATEDGSAIWQYISARASLVQQSMRRYNVLNPMLLYQLRCLNLETCQPEAPPPGHWQNVAAELAPLMSHQDRQQPVTIHRSCKASLRAIAQEQQWMTKQMLVTNARLQQLHRQQPVEVQGEVKMACNRHPLKRPYDEEAVEGQDAEPHQAHAALRRCHDGLGPDGPGINPSTLLGPPATADDDVDAPAAETSNGLSSQAACPAAAGPQISSSGVAHRQLQNEQQLGTAVLLDFFVLQQQLKEQLEALESLLIREHQQNLLLLFSLMRVPKDGVTLYLKATLSSYPYLPNTHELLAHLAESYLK
eukprot:gene4826-5074_t